MKPDNEAHTVDIKECSKQFEEWICNYMSNKPDLSKDREHDGYNSATVHFAWLGWRAASKKAAIKAAREGK